MGSKEISHEGRIIRVERGVVYVLLQTQSACGGCKARDKCGMAESAEREVEVRVLRTSDYAVGDVVKVGVTMGMGRLSVVLAYVLPLIFMVVLMCVGESLSLLEWQTALIGLGGVAFYYFFLYLVRGKIEKRINFTITK